MQPPNVWGRIRLWVWKIFRMVTCLSICLLLENAATWELTGMLRALSGVNAHVLPLPSLRASLTSWKETGKELSLLPSLSFSLPSSLGYYRQREGNLSATPYRVLTDPRPLLAFDSRTTFIQLLAPYRILKFIGRFGDWFHHNKNLKFENPLNPSEKVAIRSAWLVPAPGNFLPPKQPASFFLLSLLPPSLSFFLSVFSSLF